MADDYEELVRRAIAFLRQEEAPEFADAIEALVKEREQIGMASHKIGWRVGREAGIREAAEICDPSIGRRGYVTPISQTGQRYAEEILSLIDKQQE